MTFCNDHAFGEWIWAGTPGTRDHIELRSCQNGKTLRRESLRERNENILPFVAETDLGTKFKK